MSPTAGNVVAHAAEDYRSTTRHKSDEFSKHVACVRHLATSPARHALIFVLLPM